MSSDLIQFLAGMLVGGVILALVVLQKGKTETGAAKFTFGHGHLSAMGFDDPPGDRQADPHSSCLGGCEWLEDILSDFRRYPGTGILNSHRQQFHLVRADADADFLVFRVLHRLDRVAHKVGQHLLDLDAVDEDLIIVGGEIEHGAHALFP